MQRKQVDVSFGDLTALLFHFGRFVKDNIQEMCQEMYEPLLTGRISGVSSASID